MEINSDILMAIIAITSSALTLGFNRIVTNVTKPKIEKDKERIDITQIKDEIMREQIKNAYISIDDVNDTLMKCQQDLNLARSQILELEQTIFDLRNLLQKEKHIKNKILINTDKFISGIITKDQFEKYIKNIKDENIKI